MGAEATTPIYVPRVFDEGEMVGRVSACPVAEGGWVNRGEVIVALESTAVAAEVEAPLTGTVVRLYVKAGDAAYVGEMLAEIAPAEADGRPPAPPGARGDRAARLIERSPRVLPFVLAAGALPLPFAWVVATLAIVAVAAVRRGGVRARLGASLFRAPVAVLVGLGMALVVPGAIGALVWLATHGSDGLPAAVRLAIFAYGPRVFAYAICHWLWRRALADAERRERLIEAMKGFPDTGVAALFAGGALLVILCAIVFQSSAWWPSPSFRAVAHGLPTGLRGFVEDTRGDLVRSEAGAVVSCLRDHRYDGWRPPRVRVRPNGWLRVEVRAEPRHAPHGASLAGLMLALHNQLAPHGVRIAIFDPRARAPIEFVPETTAAPLTAVKRVTSRVEPSAGTGRALARARASATKKVTAAALACSAASP
jgi:pyruvate/2-oxoglutarate dehydrogenase complex dihydrolipoamide acyltransferase (E2) component